MASSLKKAGLAEESNQLLRFVPPQSSKYLVTEADNLNVSLHLQHLLDVQLAVLARCGSTHSSATLNPTRSTTSAYFCSSLCQTAPHRRVCHNYDDALQTLSRRLTAKAKECHGLQQALAKARADHATDAARLTQAVEETRALVAEASEAASPLYLWPSLDTVALVKNRYNQLHDTHVHLEATVGPDRHG